MMSYAANHEWSLRLAGETDNLSRYFVFNNRHPNFVYRENAIPERPTKSRVPCPNLTNGWCGEDVVRKGVNARDGKPSGKTVMIWFFRIRRGRVSSSALRNSYLKCSS